MAEKATDLLQTLQRKLAHMAGDRPSRKSLPQLRLAQGSGLDEVSGTLCGELVAEHETGNGMKILHRHALDGIDSEQALDDVLAEIISTVLMKHPQWDKNSAITK